MRSLVVDEFGGTPSANVTKGDIADISGFPRLRKLRRDDDNKEIEIYGHSKALEIQLYGAFPESSKESTVYCNYFCLVCLESFLVPLTCRALECQTILSQLQFAAATFLATRQLQTCLIHFGA